MVEYKWSLCIPLGLLLWRRANSRSGLGGSKAPDLYATYKRRTMLAVYRLQLFWSRYHR